MTYKDGPCLNKTLPVASWSVRRGFMESLGRLVKSYHDVGPADESRDKSGKWSPSASEGAHGKLALLHDATVKVLISKIRNKSPVVRDALSKSIKEGTKEFGTVGLKKLQRNVDEINYSKQGYHVSMQGGAMYEYDRKAITTNTFNKITMGHELAHAIDRKELKTKTLVATVPHDIYVQDAKGGEFTNDPEWKSAWKKDAWSGGALDMHARANPEEGLGEAVGHALKHGQQSLSDAAPNMHGLLKKWKILK